MLANIVITAILLPLAVVGSFYLGPRLLLAGWRDGIRKRTWKPPLNGPGGASDAELAARGWPVRGWQAVAAGIFAILVGLMLTAGVPVIGLALYRVWCQ